MPDHPDRVDKVASLIVSIWQSETCEFYQCRNCGYGFAIPHKAANEEIYSTLYYEAFSYPGDKWEHHRSVEIIRDLNLTGNEVFLEVGAGNGSFLDQLSSVDIPRHHIYSTEFSAPGAAEIRRKGYHCFSRSIPDLTRENIPRFDVICMFQVLEHMDDPEPVFQSLNRLGKPGSQLIIAVPNGPLRSFYDGMGVHLDVPPVHVGRFRKKTFEFLGEQHGWELLRLSLEPQRYLFKVKKFLSDRYVRVSLTRKTDLSNSKFVKYLFRYSCLFLLVIRFLPVIFYLLSPRTGTSMLVHYRKKRMRK